MLAVLRLLSLASLAAAATLAGGTTAPATTSADVVVYGAALPGAVSAIAASRSGAPSVVLAAVLRHVGGMTTGGLQHADPANETTVQGITGEFFRRVMARYPQPPPPPPGPPSPSEFACRAGRCLGVVDGKGHPTPDARCAKACAPLAPDEWLAVRRLSALRGGNRTLTVQLPPGQASTFIKRSEKLARHLPPSMSCAVKQGQVLRLAAPAVVVDETYFLVKLAAPHGCSASPLQLLVEATAADSARSPAPPLHPGAPPGWLYEGHVAEEVLEEMLAEANVTVVRGLGRLVSCTKAGAVLTSVTAQTGAVLSAKVWIDATYEGDLAAVAGAEMVWGRESVAQYNESDAGRRPASLHYAVDPFWPDGSVIPHVSNKPLVAVGEADARMEVYTFRLCITDSPSHRIPIWKPPSYNASEWEFWRRLYRHKPPADLRAAGLGCLGPVPNNYSDCGAHACIKCDMLGMKHGTDMLNGAWNWPNASIEERGTIREAHIRYITGLLWFWATDPSVGDSLRAQMATVGHCTDEYGPPQSFATDPPHWPYQLYVREGRRMVGDFVWTEHEPPAALLARTVGLGAYSFDCHWCSLYVVNATAAAVDGTASATASVAAEGRVHNGHSGNPAKGVSQAPYKVPYGALLPKRAELTNVLVPVACSSSHIRINAVRMEPAWSVQGHAAGAAAALALKAGTSVQDVDVPALQALLRAQKQMLEP